MINITPLAISSHTELNFRPAEGLAEGVACLERSAAVERLELSETIERLLLLPHTFSCTNTLRWFDPANLTQAHKPMREDAVIERPRTLLYNLRQGEDILLRRDFQALVYQVVWRSTGSRLAIVACSE